MPFWRAGLRISEALALRESDLDRSRGAVLVRRGKGGKRREVEMDRIRVGSDAELAPVAMIAASALPILRTFCSAVSVVLAAPFAATSFSRQDGSFAGIRCAPADLDGC